MKLEDFTKEQLIEAIKGQASYFIRTKDFFRDMIFRIYERKASEIIKKMDLLNKKMKEEKDHKKLQSLFRSFDSLDIQAETNLRWFETKKAELEKWRMDETP